MDSIKNKLTEFGLTDHQIEDILSLVKLELRKKGQGISIEDVYSYGPLLSEEEALEVLDDYYENGDWSYELDYLEKICEKKTTYEHVVRVLYDILSYMEDSDFYRYFAPYAFTKDIIEEFKTEQFEDYESLGDFAQADSLYKKEIAESNFYIIDTLIVMYFESKGYTLESLIEMFNDLELPKDINKVLFKRTAIEILEISFDAEYLFKESEDSYFDKYECVTDWLEKKIKLK